MLYTALSLHQPDMVAQVTLSKLSSCWNPYHCKDRSEDIAHFFLFLLSDIFSQIQWKKHLRVVLEWFFGCPKLLEKFLKFQHEQHNEWTWGTLASHSFSSSDESEVWNTLTRMVKAWSEYSYFWSSPPRSRWTPKFGWGIHTLQASIVLQDHKNCNTILNHQRLGTISQLWMRLRTWAKTSHSQPTIDNRKFLSFTSMLELLLQCAPSIYPQAFYPRNCPWSNLICLRSALMTWLHHELCGIADSFRHLNVAKSPLSDSLNGWGNVESLDHCLC